jgi:hypothetical protein
MPNFQVVVAVADRLEVVEVAHFQEVEGGCWKLEEVAEGFRQHQRTGQEVRRFQHQSIQEEQRVQVEHPWLAEEDSRQNNLVQNNPRSRLQDMQELAVAKEQHLPEQHSVLRRSHGDGPMVQSFQSERHVNHILPAPHEVAAKVLPVQWGLSATA